ncbi:exodeoxyribonuclease VIII [Aeromonas hydrophila]|nr:exodeoxyribonuclease VIII [Aeromonas hydrophila]
MGRVFGLSNEEYHAGPGVSKSQLDQIAESPATYIWAKNAPLDQEKLKAFDMGSAIHCLLLEPDEFESRFIIAPPFNRRTNAGKAEEAEFLASCAELGKTVMDAEEGRKLYLMRDSVMAHPDARWLLEQEGHSEASFYWIDPETQELCRVRPDRHLSNHPIMIDVKSVDDMGRFERHVEEFRYHVQDAMYSEGFHRVMGEQSDFVFLAVSTSVNCGRYPVRVRPLTDDWKDAGKDLFHRDLHRFHDCRVKNDWHDFKPLQRPTWATRKAA